MGFFLAFSGVIYLFVLTLLALNAPDKITALWGMLGLPVSAVVLFILLMLIPTPKNDLNRKR